MKAQELLDNLRELVRLGAIEPTQSSVFHYIADHVYEARTEKGPLTDKADFVAWLHELADASRKMLVSNKAKLDALSVANLNAEIRRTRLRLLSTCPDCGHVHQADECGQELGGGRVCRCERRVQA